MYKNFFLIVCFPFSVCGRRITIVCGEFLLNKNEDTLHHLITHSIDSNCFSSGSKFPGVVSSSGTLYASAIALPLSSTSEGTVLRRLWKEMYLTFSYGNNARMNKKYETI